MREDNGTYNDLSEVFIGEEENGLYRCEIVFPDDESEFVYCYGRSPDQSFQNAVELFVDTYGFYPKVLPRGADQYISN